MEQEDSLPCPQVDENENSHEPEEFSRYIDTVFYKIISFSPYGITGEDSTPGIRKSEFPDILFILHRGTAASIKQSRKQGTEFYLLE
jgi:hypothetical protein